MKNTALIILLGVLFFSCLPKEKEVKINKFSEKLVVNSQVIPNNIMLVSLTRSFSILSDGYTPSSDEGGNTMTNDLMNKVLVEDAIVTVSYSNNIDTLYMLAPGMYASLTTPQYKDVEYTIHAIDKSHNLEITATEKMLSQVEFNSAEFVYEEGILNFKFSFDDPSEINYYMLNIFRKNGNGNTDPNKVDINTFLSNGNAYIGGDVFTDLNFNGTTTAAKIKLSNYVPAATQDTMIVTISNISIGYFNYLSVRNKVNNNIMSQVFNEPINYPTNVQNGLGFFSTHFPDTKVLILPVKL